MKLVVVGSSGYVGTELVRQALAHPSVTSIVGLSRRHTAVPDKLSKAADPSKLKSVACEDFLNYSDEIKKEISNADACIWLMAITPAKSKTMNWEDVRKVCLDYTVAGLNTFSTLPRANASKPLSFIYTSGAAAQRDPSKKPLILGDYCLMRGQVETAIVEAANSSNGALKACIAKPGLIRSPGMVTSLIGSLFPVVNLTYVVAALLKQAVDGPEKDTFENQDLATVGKAAYEAQQGTL